MTHPNPSRRHNALFAIACLCLTAAGIWMRLSSVDVRGLWLDEIYSVLTTAPSLSNAQVIATAAAEPHPPLYDVLLHYWLRGAGNNEMASRWLSVLLGLGGIAMTGYYAGRLIGRRSAVLMALSLAATNFFLISYSVEARYYALVYVLAMGLTGHVLLYLRQRQRVQLLPVTLFSLLLAFTHLFGAFLLLALGAGLVLLAVLRRISLKSLLLLLTCFAATGALFLLWFIPVMPQGKVVSWIGRPDLAAFFEYVYDYTAKNPVETAFLLLPLILGFRLRGADKDAWMLITATIIGTYLVAFAVSLLKTPVLAQRYTMVYFPAFVLLAILFWNSGRLVPAGWEKVIALAAGLSCIINLTVIGGGVKGRLRNEPWREAAVALKDNALPVVTENAWYLNYYLRYYNQPEAILPGDHRGSGPFWHFASSHDNQHLFQLDSGFTEDSVINLGSDFYLRRYRKR